jgi:hypothetical protein
MQHLTKAVHTDIARIAREDPTRARLASCTREYLEAATTLE